MPFEASDFPTGSPLDGWHALNVRWDDLLWASITVGKAQPDLMRFGRYSFAEMLHRVACFHAYYDIDKSHRLTASSAFENLDSTEKGVVSFYLGMAMAKLYAEKVLGIPWMTTDRRFTVPENVRAAASATYRSTANPLHALLAQVTGEGSDLRVTTAAIHEAYPAWRTADDLHDEPPPFITETAVAQELTRRGYRRVRWTIGVAKVRGFIGLAIRPEWAQYIDYVRSCCEHRLRPTLADLSASTRRVGDPREMCTD